MEIEFTVEQVVVGDNLAKVVNDVLDDRVVPELTFFFTESAGLHLTLVIKASHAVELGLNEVWELEFVLVVLPFEGAHWFHSSVRSRLIAKRLLRSAQV